MYFSRLGNSALNFAEQSHNQNCVDLLRETRPVKQNPSNLPRVKRSMSSNERSEASNVAGGTTSDSNKKFDKIFTGTQQQDGRASKYMTHDEDTSELVTENNQHKHGTVTSNKDRSDRNTWGDDDSDDSDDDSDDSLSATQILRDQANVGDCLVFNTEFKGFNLAINLTI